MIGERNHCKFSVQSFYQILNEDTNMSANDEDSGGDGSLCMLSSDNSSVGSNNHSRTPILRHPAGLNTPAEESRNFSASLPKYLFRLQRKWGHRLGDDALARALMDNKYPAEGLENYENWTIDLSRLSMGAAFAEGSFGKLFRGKYDGDEDVAIKILERPADKPEAAQALERQFQQEVMMLATLNHPNIVRFVGACRKPMVWCIVTAYAKGGSVRQFLKNRQKQRQLLPLKLTIKQALDVARGMAYIHGLGFIHRDLKSDNLLIAADKSIKIADFGVARIEVHSPGMTPETGTYRWMAPEMLQNRAYDQKVDVYSFGIVLWELITGLLPFQEMSGLQAAACVVQQGLRPSIPDDCLPILRDIMIRCWDTNPGARPSFADIVSMLEAAEIEALTTVRRARFRCSCLTPPMILH